MVCTDACKTAYNAQCEDGGLWWRYEDDESMDDRIKYLYSEANKDNINGRMEEASTKSKM